MQRAVPRFASAIDLPQAAFVPGQTVRPAPPPLPEIPAPLPADFALRGWGDCQSYLYGVDLFNHGFYWEAHEAWERLWHAAKGSEPTVLAIKGLIKLGAAGVKTCQGSAVGRRRHARRAAELFRAAARHAAAGDSAAGTVLGLSPRWLAEQAQSVAAGTDRRSHAGRSAVDPPPVIVFDFVLVPQP